MKKFYFVLAILLLLVGCSSTVIDTPTQDASGEYPEEPRMINFRGGYEEIGEFMSILENDEKEIEEYLDKHHYSWFGLRTRKDVEAFFAMLNGTYFPVMENASIEYIIIPLESGKVWIDYELIDGSSYSFGVSTKLDTAEEEIQAVRSEVKDRLSENINRSSKDDIKIYFYAKEKGDDDPAEIFYMDVRGVAVGVRVFNESDFSKMSNTLQEVKFLRLDEILENLPPPVEKPTDRADVDETEGYTDEFGTFYLE